MALVRGKGERFGIGKRDRGRDRWLGRLGCMGGEMIVVVIFVLIEKFEMSDGFVVTDECYY